MHFDPPTPNDAHRENKRNDIQHCRFWSTNVVKNHEIDLQNYFDKYYRDNWWNYLEFLYSLPKPRSNTEIIIKHRYQYIFAPVSYTHLTLTTTPYV